MWKVDILLDELLNFHKHFITKAMVQHGRVELLAHPLSQKYLQMKWNSYGKYFHLANLLLYSIFLIFVTIYSSQLMHSDTIESKVRLLYMTLFDFYTC